MKTREYTNKLLDMLDEGVIGHQTVIEACLMWMSERDVKAMYEANQFGDVLDEDEEEYETQDEYDDYHCIQY